MSVDINLAIQEVVIAVAASIWIGNKIVECRKGSLVPLRTLRVLDMGN
jgi:hypothetical protein